MITYKDEACACFCKDCSSVSRGEEFMGNSQSLLPTPPLMRRMVILITFTETKFLPTTGLKYLAAYQEFKNFAFAIKVWTSRLQNVRGVNI